MNKSITTKEYIPSLIKITRELDTIDKHIAESLLNYSKENKFIKKATEFASEINVSNSSLTMFSKKLGLKNIKEVFFVHNSYIVETENSNQKQDYLGSYRKAAKIINKANKVLFIGVSGAMGINNDFQLKLLRMNKNAILVMNKYEQIGISKLMTSNDVIILNSISLQHEWMIDIIKKTEAKVILLSSWMPKSLNDKVNYWFELKVNERHDGLRLYTTQGRTKAIEIYHNIFQVLIEDEQNYKNLLLSSYR